MSRKVINHESELQEFACRRSEMVVKGFPGRCFFEANSYPEEKLSEIQIGDYDFDAGPSLFTTARASRRTIQISCQIPQDHLLFFEASNRLSLFLGRCTQINA